VRGPFPFSGLNLLDPVLLLAMFKFLQNKRENVLTSQVSIKMVVCPFREYLRDIYTKKNMLHVTAVAEELDSAAP
jgi:hypothetical protein